MNFEIILNMSKVTLVILEITLKQICSKFIKKISISMNSGPSVGFFVFTSHKRLSIFHFMMVESCALSVSTLQSWTRKNANLFIAIYKNFMMV